MPGSGSVHGRGNVYFLPISHMEIFCRKQLAVSSRREERKKVNSKEVRKVATAKDNQPKP